MAKSNNTHVQKTTREKQAKSCYIEGVFIKIELVTYRLHALGIVYDYEDSNVSNPSNYDLTTRGAAAFYNEATFDAQAIFDGNPSPVVKTSFSGSGTSIAIKYVTNDTNASHSIQGFVLLFGYGDRR